ncbi:transposase [Streptacidiphilus sp. PB12-B1b]|uniref:transposase n=1 Tax=Streptacidiphilus sp. PB12-B1b TaxID=2705012 RepID=UPI0015F86443|nr:transposase [Streptacidiphilus sp. PB12-B1b]
MPVAEDHSHSAPPGRRSTCSRISVPLDWARKYLSLTVKTVKRPPGQVGFKVLPKRWVVERTLSWLIRARRNVRDYERLSAHSEASLNWASITLMTRRIARQQAHTASSLELAAA